MVKFFVKIFVFLAYCGNTKPQFMHSQSRLLILTKISLDTEIVSIVSHIIVFCYFGFGLMHRLFYTRCNSKQCYIIQYFFI